MGRDKPFGQITDSTGGCKVETLVQGASGLSPSGNLRTGKCTVVHRSRPRARGGRENIRVGVVGDNSFGWAEAAQLWGVEVEVIIHKVQDHHCLSSCFHLPDSCDYEEALYLFPPASWDGLLLMTVGEPLDVKACGTLLEHWVPIIAIIACKSNMLRYHRAEFFSQLSPATMKKYTHF